MAFEALLDPELAPLVQDAPTFDLTPGGLAQARATTETMFRRWASDEDPETATAPGMSGIMVPLRIYRPKGDGRRPGVFFIHGGGFVLGSAAMRDGLNWELAAEIDSVVVAVDYRLAPETVFPGPLEDCYAGLRWMFIQAEALGIDPSRIVILGESGGGGLGAALALLARDRGEVRAVGQMLIYPMLDHRTGFVEDPYRNPTTGRIGWTRDDNRFGWTAMRGDQALTPEQMGYFSPARAERLDDLPPAFIAVGALDLFIDENLAYAARLARQGVSVECHVYPGAIHGFDLMGDISLVRQFRHDRRAALDRWFVR